MSFGVKKARLILEHLEAIRGLVADVDGAKPAVSSTGGQQGKPWPVAVPVSVECDNGGPLKIRHTASKPGDRLEGWKPLAKFDDDALRAEPVCRGCGKDKAGQGLLVCWDCFKRHPVCPLQTAGMDIADWLEVYGKAGAR